VAAFSLYDDGKYDIYTRQVEPQSPGDRSTVRTPASTNAATLPPIDPRRAVQARSERSKFGYLRRRRRETALQAASEAGRSGSADLASAQSMAPMLAADCRLHSATCLATTAMARPSVEPGHWRQRTRHGVGRCR
jgi:hypothetical protein